VEVRRWSFLTKNQEVGWEVKTISPLLIRLVMEGWGRESSSWLEQESLGKVSPQRGDSATRKVFRIR